MKKMTAVERKKFEKLQSEYNRLHERLGYVREARTIEAINNQLDRICEQMNELLK